jgi:Na+/phosphate symporter
MGSLLVPLATSGVIKADYYILPYILGANIGTVFDVMIAALATGDLIGLCVWLVHLAINLVGAILFMPLLNPFAAMTRNVASFVSKDPRTTLIIAVFSTLFLHQLFSITILSDEIEENLYTLVCRK